MAQLITQSLYTGVAESWASGAELVYQPLAHALVGHCPDDLGARLVLDVGAGTGAGSRALLAVGARPIAVDFVYGMLAHDRHRRPPAAVGDVHELPVRSASFGAVLAPFVLNHVDDPVVALRELARVTVPGGPVLVSTFSENDPPPVKDQIDAVAARHGWTPPAAYRWVKTTTAPLLGSATAMTDAAGHAGLQAITVVEQRVDVGISSPLDLVTYRFSQAHVAAFLAACSAAERQRIFDEAVDVVTAEHDGSSLAPAVVMLAARAPS